GGTMNAPLIRTVADALADHGHAVLRFNFRGVGRSEGEWDDGIGEQDDVAAAVGTAARAHPDLPLSVTGWSFGAATSLRWQYRDGSTLPWAGIASPVRLSSGGSLPPPSDLPPGRRLFVIGDRDQFTTVDDLREYAEAAGGRLEVLAGSDHFFHFRERAVADLVASHLDADPAGPA
ncbi:MAG TPA: alpha/beta fold hydrolase, partial [Acidimicrobiia bacterium]|nr:alpha/beta fold hydrolase [Acidimicrobiia bacterium]